MDKKLLQETLERILLEIRWIQKNMNPPVNYLLVILISIITSVLITLAMLRL